MALILNHLAVGKKKKIKGKKKSLSWPGPEFCPWSFIRIVPVVACVCVGGCSVARSCPTLYKSLLTPPGSSVRGILQARTLEWVAIPCLRAPSWPKDGTRMSCVAGRLGTAESLGTLRPGCLLAPSHPGGCPLVEVLPLPARGTRVSVVTLKIMDFRTSQVCPQPFPCWNPGWSFVDVVVVISEPLVSWKLSEVAHSG